MSFAYSGARSRSSFAALRMGAARSANEARAQAFCAVAAAVRIRSSSAGSISGKDFTSSPVAGLRVSMAMESSGVEWNGRERSAVRQQHLAHRRAGGERLEGVVDLLKRHRGALEAVDRHTARLPERHVT